MLQVADEGLMQGRRVWVLKGDEFIKALLGK